jgi:hypothetical protein
VVKQTITYVDPLTDQQVTEDHYFHISKADLLEMEMEEHNAKYTSKDGQELTGMQAHLQRIVDSADPKAVLGEFKAIVKRAYGKKVGDRFVKSGEIWADFEGSEAYSEFLFQLLTDANASAEFVNKIVPGNLDQIAKEVAARAEAEERASAPTPITAAPSAVTSAEADTGSWEATRKPVIAAATSERPVELTRVDLIEMNDQELKDGLADGRYKLS